VEIKPEERAALAGLGLLSSKPVLYVCNVEEGAAAEGNAESKKVAGRAAEEDAACVVVSAKIESEIAVLPAEEQKDYLEAVGLEEPGLNRVIRAGYNLLHLITYFTVGPRRRAPGRSRRARARRRPPPSSIPTSKRDLFAPNHSLHGLCRAQGEAGARENGKLRLEGKEYIVADGDVLHFRFNT